MAAPALQTPILLSELNDDVLAQSLIAPELCAVGPIADVRLELELLLAAYFGNLEASDLSRFAVAEQPELRSVDVVIARKELTGRLRITTPLTIPCLTVRAQTGRQDSDLWVYLVPLNATVYVRAEEDFETIVRSEVQRIASARELDGDEYVALLPPTRTWAETLHINLGTKRQRGSTTAEVRAEAEAAVRQAAEDALRSVGQHLRERARARPLLMRESALASLSSLLNGKQRSSVLLVGESGVGKTALLASWFNERVQQHDEPLVYVTSAALMLAGMSGFGQWQERLERVLQAAERLDAILYIEDMRDLLLSRQQGGADLAAYIRPWIESGRVRLVGELAKEAVDDAERRQPSFLASMTRIALTPLPAQSVPKVLAEHARYHAKHEPHRVQVSGEGLAALEDLASRYLPYGAVPGAVLRLYDELRSIERVRVTEQTTAISAADVYSWFSARSGVPLFLLREDVALRTETLTTALDAHLVGQMAAKKAVIATLCTVKARLAPRDKPLASFLFVGPTGVGKTELARALAHTLFGDADRLLRFDMSEYADPYAAERLIRGNQAHDGLLTRKLREQPFCVLLLDEVEKAHPAVFDLLLQVLGEARLSDARGRTTYFHNAIVVMTSNLGAVRQSAVGFGGEDAGDASAYTKAVRDTFRPELVNRIDRIVPFAALSRAELMPVVKMLVERIAARRGMREIGLTLEVSDEALRLLGESGFSAQYGARGMRRHLERTLSGPLARLLALLARTPNADTVAVDVRPYERANAALSKTEEAGLHFTLLGRERRVAKRVAVNGKEPRLLRARLGQLLALPSVQTMQHEHESLIAELAQARKKSTHSQVTAELEGRQHTLRAILSELHAAYDEVCSVEELTLSARWHGEEAPSYDAELHQAELRFSDALRKALASDVRKRHEVTVFAQELDDRHALNIWALGYLREAKRLHHRVQVRVDRGGLGVRWSDELSDAEAVELITDPNRTFRAILLSADGPDALLVLGLESGRVSYPTERGKAELTVTIVAHAFELTEKQVAEPRLVPLLPEQQDVARRSPCSREFHPVLGVAIANGAETVPVLQHDHFARVEAIVLAHLLLCENEPDKFDRDVLLRPLLARGERV